MQVDGILVSRAVLVFQDDVPDCQLLVIFHIDVFGSVLITVVKTRILIIDEKWIVERIAEFHIRGVITVSRIRFFAFLMEMKHRLKVILMIRAVTG